MIWYMNHIAIPVIKNTQTDSVNTIYIFCSKNTWMEIHKKKFAD